MFYGCAEHWFAIWFEMGPVMFDTIVLIRDFGVLVLVLFVLVTLVTVCDWIACGIRCCGGCFDLLFIWD